MVILLGTIVIGLPLVIVIHEAGHALMALAVGFRVYRVQLGIGKPLISFEVSRTLFSVGRRFGGRVWTAPTTLRGWKWRKAIIAASGPAISAVVGVVAVSVGFTLDGPSQIPTAIGLFGTLNLIELLNLIPSNRRPTDGGNLLLALQSSPDKARDFALAALANEIELLLDRNNALATVRARTFVSLAPERPDGWFMLGAALMQAEEFDDAHRHFRDGMALLSESGLNAEQIARIRSEMQLVIAECVAAGTPD